MYDKNKNKALNNLQKRKTNSGEILNGPQQIALGCKWHR